MGRNKKGVCGARMVIKLNMNHCFHLRIYVGFGTNTKEELVASCGLLWFAKYKQLQLCQVLGNSKVIVEWVNQKHHHHIYSLNLSHWLRRFRSIIGYFLGTAFHHIYREFNTKVDSLSKKAIDDKIACLFFEELLDGIVIDSGVLKV